ncbi:response regulator [Desulfoscipio geothermicus]|uniref:Stage 0 sporulation protein A homolog n=1 Tax=Desulfoscipio geothermicus DSM 3669 TaxID=1121426 RepID=A0A1I6D1E5_9FIRM|nr:response regulator transcription factor [Desulfoscipio geothermicus]SFQ99200.1 two component transcriptional regulator, LuxR family [Desulfoscipio geothermicus DSM 3669]
MQQITVLIVDDHALIREGIRKTLGLEERIKVLAEAANGKEAISICRTRQPDIVLLDINLPDITGVEVCRTIKQELPATEVIALTIHDQDEYIIEMIKNGIAAYLLKDISPDQLIDTILQVAEGKSFISPSLTAKIFNQLNKLSTKPPENRPWGLTDREIEVLRLVANGDSNKVIAGKLFISEKTVKNHLTNIFQKLNVSDRTQAALLAIKEKLVDI